MPDMPPVIEGQPGRVYLPPALLWPVNIWPSALPLTIVCGPPAAGKTTYVAERATPNDLVIDLDEIVREQGGQPRTDDRETRLWALKERNRRLQALAQMEPGQGAAWFITTAPAMEDRQRWAELLRPQEVLVVLCPEEECIRRVTVDPEREAYGDEQRLLIRRWWAAYTPRRGDVVITP